MGASPLPEEQAKEAIAAFQKYGTKTEAAKALGIPVTTFRSRLEEATRRGVSVPKEPVIEYPVFPDDDIPISDIIGHLSKRFEKRQASHNAHTWFTVKVKDRKPIGVLFFGDPHLDDNGANWPVLTRHTDLCRNVDGLYGANIGDTTNNWAGRLVHLYSKQDTSLKTAQKLAAWFMLDSGVKWLVWLIGNHDAWNDGAGVLAQMGKRFGTQQIVCHDWEARFILQFPGGEQFRVHAAHDFKGHSMWNPMHGPLKMSKLGAEADLFVCGDKHNWGIFRYENAERGLTQTMLRVRGYKFLDDYTRHLGITEQQGGCSILTIFDPAKPGVVQAYDNIEQGAEYLTWLRSR
jgi:hypothetical protein